LRLSTRPEYPRARRIIRERSPAWSLLNADNQVRKGLRNPEFTLDSHA